MDVSVHVRVDRICHEVLLRPLFVFMDVSVYVIPFSHAQSSGSNPGLINPGLTRVRLALCSHARCA